MSPISRAPLASARSSSRGVVDLDERLQPELEGRRDEAREPPRRMEHGEQQDEVRAGRPEQRQLDLLDHELLGQDRDGDRRPDRPQVVERAAEPVRLAQDRDRRGRRRPRRPGRARRGRRRRRRSGRPTATRA